MTVSDLSVARRAYQDARRERTGHHAPSECGCRLGTHPVGAISAPCLGYATCAACAARWPSDGEPARAACRDCDPLLEHDADLPSEVLAVVGGPWFGDSTIRFRAGEASLVRHDNDAIAVLDRIMAAHWREWSPGRWRCEADFTSELIESARSVLASSGSPDRVSPLSGHVGRAGMCPHGLDGDADGSCILDVGHPLIACPSCGDESCPCDGCWSRHQERRGCATSRADLALALSRLTISGPGE